MTNKPTVIRVVKKKAAAPAYHGGSWKVAYADFVTAMMAFFLVLWLLSMDQKLKEEIQSYFNNPYSPSNSVAGISKLADGGKSPIATGTVGMNAKNWRELAMEAQRERFDRVHATLQKEIAGCPDLSRLRQHVTIEVGRAGLRIELIDTPDATFFESGSAQLPLGTKKLLTIIARQLGQLANPVIIEGYTDVVPYHAGAPYSNWELSTDRANAARRLMEAAGLRPRQVMEVRGYADSQLRDAKHPTNASNRRVSILVNYSEAAASSPLTGDLDRKQSEENERPFSLDIQPR